MQTKPREAVRMLKRYSQQQREMLERRSELEQEQKHQLTEEARKSGEEGRQSAAALNDLKRA